MVTCDEDSLRNRNRLSLSKFPSGKLATIFAIARNFMCVVRLQSVATEVQHLVLVGIHWPAGSKYRTDTL